jgi:hypothetical protein
MPQQQAAMVARWSTGEQVAALLHVVGTPFLQRWIGLAMVAEELALTWGWRL